MPIKDEFTNLPVSRQRKWQLRHKLEYKTQYDKYQSSKRGKLMQLLGYYKKKLSQGKGTEKQLKKMEEITEQLARMPGGKP